MSFADPPHATIYALIGEWRAIYDDLEAECGELTPEIEARMLAAKGTLTQKADGMMRLVRNFELLASSARQEASRLEDLARRRENTAARIKALLLTGMQGMDQKRVHTPLFNVTRVLAAPRVEWKVPAERLSYRYRNRVVIYEYDREAVLARYAAGKKLPAGVEVTRHEHLRIT